MAIYCVDRTAVPQQETLLEPGPHTLYLPNGANVDFIVEAEDVVIFDVDTLREDMIVHGAATEPLNAKQLRERTRLHGEIRLSPQMGERVLEYQKGFPVHLERRER